MRAALTVTLLFVLAVVAVGQTPLTPALPDTTFALGGFVSYNQLGTPQVTGGGFALYTLPVPHLYGSTTAIIVPKVATDPDTGRSFYAVNANIVQHVHYDITLGKLDRFKLLVGAGAGPSFGQDQPSGIAVSMNTSFMATPFYRITPVWGIALPVQMLYIKDVGWNPVAAVAFTINLKALSAKFTK